MSSTSTTTHTFNLQLDAYTFQQILAFFGYKPTDQIVYDELTIRSESLRTQLLASGRIQSSSFQAFEHFITEATRWVIAVKCPQLPKTEQIRTHPPPNPSAVEPPRQPTTAMATIPPATPPLIDPSTQSAQYVVPLHFAPGTRNPIQRPTIRKYVTVDSRHRTNYYTTSASDFTIEFPEKITRVVDMQLSSFELPLAFYNIAAELRNHFFTIGVSYVLPNDETILTTKYTVCIPDGNYTATELIETINQLIAPRDPDGNLRQPENALSYVQFTVDMNEATGSGTGKITISYIENVYCTASEVQLYFGLTITGEDDRTELTHKLGWKLGFQQRSYAGTTTYTSESILDIAPMQYMYLVVEDNQRASSTSFMSTLPAQLQPAVFARVSIKGSPFTVLHVNSSNCVTEPRSYFGPATIQKVRIRLLDDWGRPICMNATNFSVCFAFTILYDTAL